MYLKNLVEIWAIVAMKKKKKSHLVRNYNKGVLFQNIKCIFQIIIFFSSLRFLKSQREVLDIYHIKRYAKLKQNWSHRFFTILLNRCQNSQKTHQKLSTLEVFQNQIVNIFFIYSYFCYILTPHLHLSLLQIQHKIYIYYIYIIRKLWE